MNQQPQASGSVRKSPFWFAQQSPAACCGGASGRWRSKPGSKGHKTERREGGRERRGAEGGGGERDVPASRLGPGWGRSFAAAGGAQVKAVWKVLSRPLHSPSASCTLSSSCFAGLVAPASHWLSGSQEAVLEASGCLFPACTLSRDACVRSRATPGGPSLRGALPVRPVTWLCPSHGLIGTRKRTN